MAARAAFPRRPAGNLPAPRRPAAPAAGAGTLAAVSHAEEASPAGAGEDEPAAPGRYMLIFRGGAVSGDDVSPSALQAHLQRWYDWSDELAREGRRNAGSPLDGAGRTVGGHGRVVTDGPYAESKDLVTGAMVIDAASLDDALAVARRCPTFEFGGSVEVRPVLGHHAC